MSDTIEGLQVCTFIGCNACAGNFDCSTIHAYRRTYGTRAAPEAKDNLFNLLFPRWEQRELETAAKPKVTQANFMDTLGEAHDRMLADYDQNAEREKQKANRYSKKPSWVK